jgi:hypothetical protein
VWGVGCGVLPVEVANYLIFRGKVPEFPPRSLPYPVLFN